MNNRYSKGETLYAAAVTFFLAQAVAAVFVGIISAFLAFVSWEMPPPSFIFVMARLSFVLGLGFWLWYIFDVGGLNILGRPS